MRMYQSELRWQPVVLLLVLSLVWGANMAFIKIAALEMPTLLQAAIRSLVAAACLFVWMKAKRMAVFPSRAVFLHGLVLGLLFGGEFGFIYSALDYTLASRVYVLLYTAPFFASLQAHVFLEGDRLNVWRIAGLTLAFFGVASLFLEDLGTFTLLALRGDLLALGAAFLWASTTVYLKRFLAHQTAPLQTLFYQLFFSIPLLFILSAVFEEHVLTGLSFNTWFSLFFQSIIVAFLSYLVWFELIHRYPVSLLHAFSFFTPVFGVFLSGALMLGESVGLSVIVALCLVSVGMILVNRRG